MRILHSSAVLPIHDFHHLRTFLLLLNSKLVCLAQILSFAWVASTCASKVSSSISTLLCSESNRSTIYVFDIFYFIHSQLLGSVPPNWPFSCVHLLLKSSFFFCYIYRFFISIGSMIEVNSF